MPVSKEDEAFWRETVKGVRKTAESPVVTPPEPEIKIKIRQHTSYAAIQEFSSYSKNLDDFNAGGIDSATLRKFKKEEFRIEAVLDLHGRTEDDAFAEVDDFVAKSYERGLRCIMIITGKGGIHQEDDIFAPRGVLKQRVPQWLDMPRLRALILIYKHPSERLGGNGALYILLRRNKNISAL